MSTHRSTKKLFIAFVFMAISIAVFSMDTACNAKSDINQGELNKNIAPGTAAPSLEDTPGKEVMYIGQIETKDGTITSVNLSLKNPLIPGKKGAVLSYGGKRMCACQGTYDGEKDKRKIFSLISQNGGSFCDKLDNLEVSQAAENTTDIFYTTSSSDKTTTEKGKLSKAAKQ